MFDLLSSFLSSDAEACITEGHCTPVQEPTKDIMSFAIHTSKNGVYTADQVLQYRQCSNDFATQFKSTWDGNPWSGHGVKGYSPIGGNDKVEAFRICWEPLITQYPGTTLA